MRRDLARCSAQYPSGQPSESERVGSAAGLRHGRLNAFTRPMWAELRDGMSSSVTGSNSHTPALTSVNGDKGIRAVILMGSGRAFSAGVDIADASAAITEECDDVVDRTRLLREYILVSAARAAHLC